MSSKRRETPFRKEARLDRKRKGKRPSITVLRIGEMNRLFLARYGPGLPNDDKGRQCAVYMAEHLAQLGGDPKRRIGSWLRTWAPWMPIADAEQITIDAIILPRRWTAQALAWKLKLLDMDRATLKIRTIGAVDTTPATRATARRQSRREREQQRRRANGAMPRHVYEAASTNKLKPWLALGMSRAKWYRSGRPPPPETT